MTKALKQQRIPELDGLRGIAVILVISFHYLNNQLVDATGFTGKLIGKVTSIGWVGVDLFFILSGFLIGTILIQNKHSKNYFSTFYIRRIVRIVPNYFLLILIFLTLTAVPYFSDNYFLTGNNVIPIWSYLMMVHNLFMAHLNNLGNIAMSVTWSIGIEEQFYIIFPFIVYFLKEKWLPWILGCAIILAVIFRMQYNNWIPPYVLLHCRMDAISLGAIIAYLNNKYDLAVWVNRYFKWVIGILTFDIFICAYKYYQFQDLGNMRNTYFGIFFSICLIFALTYKKTIYAAFLRNKILMWIGSISYSLYLFHYMLLGLFQHFAGNGLGLRNVKDVIITSIALIISMLFSWALYLKLETPMVKIGKKFKY